MTAPQSGRIGRALTPPHPNGLNGNRSLSNRPFRRDDHVQMGFLEIWSMNAPAQVVPPYRHTPLFPLGRDSTKYRKLMSEGVRVDTVFWRDVVVVEREAMRAVAEAAFTDINHLLRPGHLAQLRAILDDPEASENDKFVAYDFLKNANIAAGGVLPMCQDTGTAIIMGKKGRLIWTEGDDEAALDVRGEEHQEQHAGAGRDLRRRPGKRIRLQVPVHRQGRRLGQQGIPLS